MKLRTASESVGWLNTVGPLTVSPRFDTADEKSKRIAMLADQIIDAIPQAIGMTPDPWPEEGARSGDNEPHATIEWLIREWLVRYT